MRRDEDAFIDAIVAAPGDPLPRCLFADWLDEHGRTAEAAGQRWAAREGKYPQPSGWWWGPSDGCPSHCQLPEFWPDSTISLSRGYELFERTFLDDCRRLAWSDSGNPLPTRSPAGVA